MLYISQTSRKKGQAKQMPSRKPINKQSFRFQFSAQKKYYITWKFVPNGIEMHCRLYCCSWCRFAIAQQYIDVYCLWVWGERGPFVAVRMQYITMAKIWRKFSGIGLSCCLYLSHKKFCILGGGSACGFRLQSNNSFISTANNGMKYKCVHLWYEVKWNNFLGWNNWERLHASVSEQSS